MKRYHRWHTLPFLALLALSLQSCLGFNDQSNTFQTTSTGSGKTSIGVNKTVQAVFKGKIYFTLDRSLYVLDGLRNINQLTKGMDVRDPAVSPDGKWIAFIARYQDYSDLMLMPSAGGAAKILRTGAGQYIYNPNSAFPKSTDFWYAQPAWAPDSKRLLFLSDFAKTYVYPGVDSFLLDLQVFSISIDNPTATPQEVAYATYGDGGNRDPSYRPGHPDQIIYTHYAYDPTGTKQLVQLYLEDPNAISVANARIPDTYKPGVTGIEVDPSVPLTPPTPDIANLQPAFSPDGNSLAYIRRIDTTHMGLFTMPVAENVTNNPNDPTVQKNALLPYTKSSLILTQQYVSQPVWSPDGKQIAYMTYTNSVFDIWLVSISTNPKTGVHSMKGDPVQLTNANGHLDADSGLCWTP